VQRDAGQVKGELIFCPRQEEEDDEDDAKSEDLMDDEKERRRVKPTGYISPL
jgi:hypothetical protein